MCDIFFEHRGILVKVLDFHIRGLGFDPFLVLIHPWPTRFVGICPRCMNLV